jgi:hypothetical protein
MHDPSKSGNEFFICDFCKRSWADDRPMIEGHQGSLICTSCLTPAYGSLVFLHEGQDQLGKKCTMCLEDRNQPQWQSPIAEDSRICIRCVRQAAGVLSADPDFNWKRPTPPAGVSPTTTAADEEQIDADNV